MEHHNFTPGIPSLLIHGSIYHNLGPLTPAGTPPTFLQVYFHDGVQNPVGATGRDPVLINLLTADLQQHNAYLLHMNAAIRPVLRENGTIATAPKFTIQISDKPLDGQHAGT